MIKECLMKRQKSSHQFTAGSTKSKGKVFILLLSLSPNVKSSDFQGLKFNQIDFSSPHGKMHAFLLAVLLVRVCGVIVTSI